MASSIVLPSQNKIQYHLFVYVYHHVDLAVGGEVGDTFKILLHMTFVVIIGLEMALYLAKAQLYISILYSSPCVPKRIILLTKGEEIF